MHQKQPPPNVAFSSAGLDGSALASDEVLSPGPLAGSAGASSEDSGFSRAFASSAFAAPLRRVELAPGRPCADASMASPRTRKAASRGARRHTVMVELLDDRLLERCE